MKSIVITGSGGLVGYESCLLFLKLGYKVIGIDNNLRQYFFGSDGNVSPNIDYLNRIYSNYTHYNVDIRDDKKIDSIFSDHSSDIEAVIHAAAQPSHDWAVKDVFTDFDVNAKSTLNLLNTTKKYAPKSTFIFMSTNKVYGDNPNYLDLIEKETRYELKESDPLWNGIDETFSVDRCKHSLFGCSKLAADVYVQEFGKYFGMKTVVFRGGCLTGSRHKGAELHGFLNYLVKCNLKKNKYTVYGYKGKQVRDNLHAYDLASAFQQVILDPCVGEVFNIGGSRYSNCSLTEAGNIIESITNLKMDLNYTETNRIGDHIWWISDITKFKNRYPNWIQKYDIKSIISEIINNIEI